MADATCWAFPWPRLVLTWVLQTRSVSDFIYLVEVGFGNICDVTEVSWQWDTSLDSNFILHIQLTQTKGDFTVQDSLNVPVLTVTCPKRSCMEPLRNHVGTQCFSLNISDFECLDYGCSACTSAVTCLHLGSPRSNPPPPRAEPLSIQLGGNSARQWKNREMSQAGKRTNKGCLKKTSIPCRLVLLETSGKDHTKGRPTWGLQKLQQRLVSSVPSWSSLWPEMSNLFNIIYRFNAITTKIPMILLERPMNQFWSE